MSYKRLQQEAFGKCCRECMNKIYHVRLKRQDCIYVVYPGKCIYCGEMKNIVEDIRRGSRIKVIF